MRRLERLTLGLVSSVVTVFIACCYGIPYAFSKGGKVVDAGTKLGIGGIRVSCADRSESTWADGSFYFAFHPGEPDCAALRFEDVDGADNGAYQPKLVEGVPPGEQRDLLVELDPVP
ncbi:peptidase associated/transthyretin-like domain-containing protein [Anaeromyxobacter oryzae]|uniref:Lipoprotein n=1 Tax=Anaeromyxobacter oryzae TaxID=2918170 RepID=A0ABM7WNV1_9BACT|nr:hypothetical protein [Anaeromyxobacter oryzae]BDG01139.1 hypothetical protein AMOR_01350 [Anaeromyxobacter oryzae]